MFRVYTKGPSQAENPDFRILGGGKFWGRYGFFYMEKNKDFCGPDSGGGKKKKNPDFRILILGRSLNRITNNSDVLSSN